MSDSLQPYELQHTSFSYTYTYIHSSSDSFPIWVISEYWVVFPVLYSRSLLFVYFLCSTVCVLIPSSSYIPYMSDIIWCLSFSVWLTSFRMMISRLIHVAANGIISVFLWLNNIPLCTCSTLPLSIHLLMDIYVASMSWLLWIVL